MLSKFAIDYVALPRHHSRLLTQHLDDPIAVEEFLMHLLVSGAHIKGIRHEGAALTGSQFDRMLKVAAERIASTLLRESLHADAVAVRDRFGLAA